MKSLFHQINLLMRPVFDFRKFFSGIFLYIRFFKEKRMFEKISGKKVPWKDLHPCLFNRSAKSLFDAHYFFQAAWAFRRIAATPPSQHTDIGSQLDFVGMLSAILPVTFVDIRPLEVSLDGLKTAPGNILKLPYESNSLMSISCLHVIEHIGLGRYGDALDPEGPAKAAAELTRVLASGGKLFVSVPIGDERICFNAHRVFFPETVLAYFSELKLVEFSAVSDEKKFLEHVKPETFRKSKYACGLFCFQKLKKGETAHASGA